jgi:hypothetical protein
LSTFPSESTGIFADSFESSKCTASQIYLSNKIALFLPEESTVPCQAPYEEVPVTLRLISQQYGYSAVGSNGVSDHRSP